MHLQCRGSLHPRRNPASAGGQRERVEQIRRTGTFWWTCVRKKRRARPNLRMHRCRSEETSTPELPALRCTTAVRILTVFWVETCALSVWLSGVTNLWAEPCSGGCWAGTFPEEARRCPQLHMELQKAHTSCSGVSIQTPLWFSVSDSSPAVCFGLRSMEGPEPETISGWKMKITKHVGLFSLVWSLIFSS